MAAFSRFSEDVSEGELKALIQKAIQAIEFPARILIIK